MTFRALDPETSTAATLAAPIPADRWVDGFGLSAEDWERVVARQMAEDMTPSEHLEGAERLDRLVRQGRDGSQMGPCRCPSVHLITCYYTIANNKRAAGIAREAARRLESAEPQAPEASI